MPQGAAKGLAAGMAQVGGPHVSANRPGEIVVVEIPLATFGAEFSLKSILKEAGAGGKSKAAGTGAGRAAATTAAGGESGAAGENNENELAATATAAAAAVSSGKAPMPAPKLVGAGGNFYSNFVEQLERKYTAQHVGDVGSSSEDSDSLVLENGEDESMDGDSDDESVRSTVDLGTGAGAAKATAGGKDASASASGSGPAPKKRRRKHDFYDYDDIEGFIDDSEVEVAVERSLQAKHKKTKESGFFQAAAGELELEVDPAAARALAKHASSAAKQAAAAGGASPAADKKAAAAAAAAAAAMRPPLIKPQWSPTPGTLDALQVRRVLVLVLVLVRVLYGVLLLRPLPAPPTTASND